MTVKPIALTRWLATLLLPPPEYAPRRILVPFAGVMSEAIGAMLAGWEEIVAIELDESYCEIGRARLRFWQGWSQRTGETDPKALLKLARKEEQRREKQERSETSQLELTLEGK